LNSIESRSLVRHRTVVGPTATPGSRGTHFDAVDPHGPRARRPPRGCNCDANSRTTAPAGSVANPVQAVCYCRAAPWKGGFSRTTRSVRGWCRRPRGRQLL